MRNVLLHSSIVSVMFVCFSEEVLLKETQELESVLEKQLTATQNKAAQRETSKYVQHDGDCLNNSPISLSPQP